MLVVFKQTPYDTYLQLKAQGKAPVALRWERLRNRSEKHKKCVEDVVALVKRSSAQVSVVGRDELHRGCLVDKDLVIAVGGDGTVLNASSFLDDDIPIIGVNSDPTLTHEHGVVNLTDERRSTGQLCAATSANMDKILPDLFAGNFAQPHLRSRINCVIRSTHTITRLPPALNDILIANPTPAAVSRFRLNKFSGRVHGYFTHLGSPGRDELFSFNCWSSGMWVSTATGSTAVMKAAGGVVMDTQSTDLQYKIREHLCEPGQDVALGHGFIGSEEMLAVRWNSQYGSVFVDGAHMRHDLELGDVLAIDSHAAPLKLFNRPE